MRMGIGAGLAIALSLAGTAAAGAPAVATGSPGAAVGNVKAGVDAWTRGDFAAAIAQWRGPAASGDADAQFNLAQAYKLGKGVSMDLRQAEQLYASAARAGHIQAADNYGLLLFQSGRREEAMNWIVASAERGEPRAQYVLATAHFNGDMVPKDRVRSYALMSRAAAAGLDQAKESLEAMDIAIPLEERQQGVALAAQLEQEAQTLRSAQFAAADLGKPVPQRRVVGSKKGVVPAALTAAPAPSPAPATVPAPAPVAKPVLQPEVVTAGADFAHPVALAPPAVAKPAVVKPAVVKTAPPSPAPAALAKVAVLPPGPAAAAGSWRVQLGAFSVAGNAEAQWAKLRGRAPLAGTGRFLVSAGGLTRLQAGPFVSKAAADAACAALAGQACIPVKP